MRAYQLEGLNWMIKLHDNGINGILADEVRPALTAGCRFVCGSGSGGDGGGGVCDVCDGKGLVRQTQP